MEKTSTLISRVFDSSKDYLQLKTRSVILEVYDKGASTAANAINGLSLGLIGIFAFLFLNIGLGFLLAEAFESNKWGFLTLGGIYIILGGIFLAVKGAIDKKIRDKVVVKMSNNHYVDHESMQSDKKMVNDQLQRTELIVKATIEELKDNAQIVADDFKKIKADIQRFRELFGFHEADQSSSTNNTDSANPEGSPKKPGMLQKLALTAIAELFISRFVLKDVDALKKIIIPLLGKFMQTEKQTQTQGEAGSPPPDTGNKGGFINTIKAAISHLF